MTLRLEAHRGCHLHNNSKVFWNDVSIRGFVDDDGFRTVSDEKKLVNLESSVTFTAGKFSLPPTSSTTSIPSSKSPIFQFKKCENPEKFVKKFKIPAAPPVVKQKHVRFQEPRKPTEKKVKIVKNSKKNKENADEKRSYYSKIHRNAVQTIPAKIYTRGKKCDLSQKVFVCDICELSFTLRHNLQVHLLAFHGDTANMTDEIVARLKRNRPKKDQDGEN